MSNERAPDQPLLLLGRWPGLRRTNNELSDGSSGSILPTSYDDEEWRQGWTDGRIGPEAALHGKVFTYEARRRALEKAEAYDLAVAMLDEDVATTATKAARASGDLQRVENAFQAIDSERLATPGSFSRGLGLFYVIVAFVLFLADIPLSLLAADGLGIRTNYEALADLRTLQTSWTRSWEPIAFALGIAALGLFFKFVADFFFKPKYAKSRLMKAVSLLMLLAVLAIVGSNLFLLAKVRVSVQAMQDGLRLQTVGQKIDVDALSKEAKRWAEWSFICLTVTLPLLGGICASTGYSRVEANRRYRTLAHERDRLRPLADEAANAFAAAKGKLKQATTQRANTQVAVDDAAASAYALYQHGFLRGFAVPETLYEGKRLHERVKMTIQRWLAIVNQRGEFEGHSPEPPPSLPALPITPVGSPAPADGREGHA